MKNNKSGNRLVTVIFFFVCIMLGGLLGYSMTQAFGDTLSGWETVLRIVEGVLLFLLAFFLQVVIHEAGHMIVGLVRGWSFIHFMVLGVVFSNRNGKLHLSRFAIPGVGGQCLMMPPEKGDTNFGIALYNAGGVLMNLAMALLVAVLQICHYESLSWDANVLLVSLCATGVIFAFINGVPFMGSGVPNDGMNICELRKDAFSTHVFLTTMRIMGRLQQGASIEQISEEYLANGYLADDVVIDYANPLHVVAVNFDLSLAVARMDFEKAYAVLDRLEEAFNDIVPIYQKEIMYEKVFLNVVSPRKEVDVKQLIDPDTLTYFELQSNFRPTALRVKYAFTCLYENDKEKAKAIYEQFQRVCETYHIPGEVQSEKRLVEYVLRLDAQIE